MMNKIVDLSHIKSKCNLISRYCNEELYRLTRSHLSKINSQRSHYSNYYSPNKVIKLFCNNKKFDIGIRNIPSIGRYFHDIHIYPKNKKFLTIPIANEAKHKSAKDFANLIFVQYKNKTKYGLFARINGVFKLMFALVKHVKLNMDNTILPSIYQYKQNILIKIKSLF